MGSVGRRIAFARELAGMTQKDLAAAIDKSRPTIVQYEADKISPPLSMIVELARSLGTTPEFLAFGIDLAPTNASQKVEVAIGALELDGGFTATESAFLPGHLVRDSFGISGTAQLVRLDQDARKFGLSKGDLLLVDRSAEIVVGDGKYYAIPTSAGLSVILNAVQLTQRPDEYEIQDGSGDRYRLGEAPSVLGRVCGALINL